MCGDPKSMAGVLWLDIPSSITRHSPHTLPMFLQRRWERNILSPLPRPPGLLCIISSTERERRVCLAMKQPSARQAMLSLPLLGSCREEESPFHSSPFLHEWGQSGGGCREMGQPFLHSKTPTPLILPTLMQKGRDTSFSPFLSA